MRALRLGIERAHESQAFGQGLTFLHVENMPLAQAIIEAVLRLTGTYWRGLANARKLKLIYNEVRVRLLPEEFDGFTILHLSDLHADMNERALVRLAELVADLRYDICVLTGDYRGRKYGACRPCLEIIARLRSSLRGDIYGVLGNHDSIAMVPDMEALGIRMLLNEFVTIDRGPASLYLDGRDTSMPPASVEFLPTPPLLDVLDSLLAKNLLRQESTGDEPRFTMLQTIREYADEQLRASGEFDTIRDRCAAFFLAMAEQAAHELLGREQLEWLARLDAELDQLRTVFGWSRTGEISSNVGLRLAGALVRYWEFRGLTIEGHEWVAAMLATPEAASFGRRPP
jgi:hypothetical protein